MTEGASLSYSIFDLAISRLVLLAGAVLLAQVAWITLITRALNATVNDLFTKPAVVLLPWLAPATLSAFLIYWLGVRLLERRKVGELALADAPLYLTVGAIGGFILFGMVMSVLWAGRWVAYDGYAGLTNVAATLLIFAAGATFEELIYRGAIFRIVEESLGTMIALTLSAILFGASHLGNTAATMASALSIAVAGGMVFGLAYTLTRSLWLPIGLHFGWNFAQGGMFGAAVSGHPVRGLLKFTLSGPSFVTGGAFGPEASIYTTIFGVIVATALGVVAYRRGQWTPLRFRFRVS